jgi:hypothetical protein
VRLVPLVRPVRKAQQGRLVLLARSARRARPVRLVPLVLPARKARPVRLALLVLRAPLVRPVRKAQQGRLVLLARSARRAQPVNAGPQVPLASAVRLVRRARPVLPARPAWWANAAPLDRKVRLASVARRAKRRRAEHASVTGPDLRPVLLTPWPRGAIKPMPSLRPRLSRIRGGLRWRAAPPGSGPHKTLYNRFAAGAAWLSIGPLIAAACQHRCCCYCRAQGPFRGPSLMIVFGVGASTYGAKSGSLASAD